MTLEFKEDGVKAVAEIAASVNERNADIGARRLHTVMEKLLDELSFDAPDLPPTTVVVDREMVHERLGELVEDQDLSQYIL
ncbi:MAG: ATP-dependent protease ATP-binding subunit HslU [Deltaproteobacteria bacterium]|nr:ATP-dependent protease ATP-binding subunit HslU [Deltaproteobacteria bacterium]